MRERRPTPDSLGVIYGERDRIVRCYIFVQLKSATWFRNVTEEATDFTFLISGSTLLLALFAFYIGRALWIARREWPECRTDTKMLYLLVAPPLTLAVDLLAFTDRLFWNGKTQPVRLKAPPRNLGNLRPKMVFRSDS